jgi:glycosyltransferase involved in cell wall biosynthesis
MYEIVDVLLATFNGEKYLAEFLESLSKQKSVHINLIVSDDGSTDRTVEIIKSLSKKFHSVHIYNGPKNGPMKNFFYLLEKSSAKFVAFADQDDIWLPDHLCKSIDRLRCLPQAPALSFSSVNVFRSGSTQTLYIWPKKQVSLKLESLLFQNLVRGCTIVVNKELIDALDTSNNEAIMHDWWLALFALTQGYITFGSQPEVNYRLHNNNAIGEGDNFKIRFLHFVITHKRRLWKPLNQINSLLDIYGNQMYAGERESLTQIRDVLIGKSFRDRWKLAISRHRYRQSLLDEFALRIFLLRRWEIL